MQSEHKNLKFDEEINRSKTRKGKVLCDFQSLAIIYFDRR